MIETEQDRKLDIHLYNNITILQQNFCFLGVSQRLITETNKDEWYKIKKKHIFSLFQKRKTFFSNFFSNLEMHSLIQVNLQSFYFWTHFLFAVKNEKKCQKKIYQIHLRSQSYEAKSSLKKYKIALNGALL